MKKKEYIQPWAELILVQPHGLLEGYSKRPTGYAIDNDDANDDLIITIQEQDDDDKLKDDFIEID